MSLQDEVGSDTVSSGLALALTHASKTFGGQQVLRDVSLEIRPGEIRALVGENGSGKSTLVKILAGYHGPDAGTGLQVRGRPVALQDPVASDAAGLRFVHQDLALVAGLDTVENLGLGRGYGARPARPVRWSERRREARAVMEQLGYVLDVDKPVAALEASERTAVAVARAISPHRTPPRVLVLDEPTANLPGREVERLFDLVRRVRDTGLAILFISHHLNEVFDLTESVTILRGGRHVATRKVENLTEGSLIELMVGRDVARTRGGGAATSVASDTVLSARALAGPTLDGVDLRVAACEVLGIAGITGSGREALASMLFGAQGRQGTVEVNGTVLKGGRPDLSIGAGVALVPADRAQRAVVQGLDVGENLSITRAQDFMRGGLFRRRLERTTVLDWLRRLDVRPQRPSMPMSQLSGGNAQKVVLARWLRLRPKVLLLDEPTQGVDVGAREEIYDLVRSAAADGCAVVLCSTDSEELARCCSRVVVLVRGRVRSEMKTPLEAYEITAASLGGGPGGHRS